MKIPMSVAAAGLLRSLLARAGANHDRILLIESQSTEWQSLTFIGERHLMSFRVLGPDADEIIANMTFGLGDAEFSIPGQIVADVGLAGAPRQEEDGSIALALEALTIVE